MVTKYDVFEVVYKNRAPTKPIEVVKKLNKDEKEYHLIHRYLRELTNERLLVKKKEGFDFHIYGPETPMTSTAKIVVDLVEKYRKKIKGY